MRKNQTLDVEIFVIRQLPRELLCFRVIAPVTPIIFLGLILHQQNNSFWD